MSVLRVTLTSAEEEHAPPVEEIDVAVVGDRVIITVYSGSAENVPDDREVTCQVPPLLLGDLLAALGASGAGPHIVGAMKEPS